MFGLEVKDTLFFIGSPSYLTPFFSNICINLESGNQGSRFPIIMKELYWGTLEYNSVQAAMKELDTIEEELKQVSVSKYVFEFLEPKKKMPEGLKVNSKADNLCDYMVNMDGRPVISVIRKAFKDAIYYKEKIVIKNMFE